MPLPDPRLTRLMDRMPPDVADYFVALLRDVSEQHKDATAFTPEGREWFTVLDMLMDKIRSGQ